jgi:tRNA (guanine37-N1)-methyltransferase
MAAAVLTETVVRLLPGVIPKPEATKEESFGKKFKLEYPQYTRPSMYKGLSVPKILLSGNHPKIQEWRRRKSSL